jgi:predicted Zn-ribbon and HTH transcriptional regulator
MVRKCPQCKSKNIDLYMGGQFGKYQCKDCGYVGAIVIEED